METQGLISDHSSGKPQADLAKFSQEPLSVGDILLTAGKAVIVLFAIQGIVASVRELRDALHERHHLKTIENRWERFSQEEERALRQP